MVAGGGRGTGGVIGGMRGGRPARWAAIRRLVPFGLSYAASSGSLVAASAAQLLTFGLLARALGPAQFGLFVQVTALTTVAAQVCGLGASDCLIRRVAQDPRAYPAMLGHALLLIAGTGAGLVALGLAVLPAWIPVVPDPAADPAANLAATGLLLVTNIVLVRAILLAETVFIAHSRFADANRAVVAYALARTATACLACLAFGVTTLAGWAAWQFAGNLAVAFAYAAWLRGLGRPRLALVRDEIRLGLLFCSQFVARAVRGNADLFVLGLVAPIEVVGSYGVARRILDSSYLPIDALNRLVYPRFARASLGGVHAALASARSVVPAALALGGATAAGLFLLAPWLPWVFGRDYASLVLFVRVLSGTVVLVAAWSVAMDVLGASRHQGARAWIVNTANLAGSVLVAGATWAWPPMGTLGALYAIEVGTGIAAWLVLFRLARRSRAAAVAAA